MILIACLVSELCINKLILRRTTWGCDCKDIVSGDCSLFSSSCIGERLDCGDCILTTNKYSRELSACNC